MTIPTPGTNSFASAFNTDESEGGGGGDIFGSFCVENVSKFLHFDCLARKKKHPNSCEFKERDDDDKKPIHEARNARGRHVRDRLQSLDDE